MCLDRHICIPHVVRIADAVSSAGECKQESDTLILLAQLYEDSCDRFDHCLQYYQQALDAIGQGAEDAQPCDVASLMLRLASARLKKHLQDASVGAETEFADLEATEEELRFVIESASDLQEVQLKSRAELELSTVSIARFNICLWRASLTCGELQVLMLMGQCDEAVSIARQAKSDAQSVGDEALSVKFFQ